MNVNVLQSVTIFFILKGITRQGFCGIVTTSLQSKAGVSYSGVIRTLSTNTALDCVVECLVYTASCTSVSYKRLENICRLHPTDSTGMEISLAGYTFYYSQDNSLVTTTAADGTGK